jgi:hypothetical protein
MNMYAALRATAAHIHAHPQLYNYHVTRIPLPGDVGPESWGCMLGRLAHIVGYQNTGRGADAAAPALLGISHSCFFERIADIMRKARPYAVNLGDPKLVAPAVLAYAEMYRAELEVREYPIPAIPAAVRDIFNPAQFVHVFGNAGKPIATKKYNINTDSYELVPS